jgi:DNA-3-methyladenine glycosylase
MPPRDVTAAKALKLRPLRRTDFPCETLALSKFLIGKVLVREEPRGLLTGRIVETEGYPPGDEAGHHRSGLTKRNASLFRACGHIYVYRAYGTAMMLNISSEAEGIGGGVLIRAAEPLGGLDVMRERRGVEDIRMLAKGPGRLAQAFDIDFSLDGHVYAVGQGLYIADDGTKPPRVASSVRIGITRNVDKPWRYFVRGSRFVSGPAWLNEGESQRGR